MKRLAAIVIAMALTGCGGARERFCWNETKDHLVVRTCCQDKRDLGMYSWAPDGPVTCTPVRIEKEPPCR